MRHPKPKAILITGAGKRIGRTLALTAASRGYGIVAHYHRSIGAILELKNEVEKFSVPFHSIQWNLEKDPLSLISSCRRLPVTLFGLVNNASMFEKGNLLVTSNRRLNRLMQVNVGSPLTLMRDFGHSVQEGFIVNLLDANIDAYHEDFQAYRASKRALRDLTHDLAHQLAPAIRVNAIAPGAVLPSKFTNSQLLRKSGALLDNGGTLEGVASAFGYLLENRSVTGQILHVDGGIHLRQR